MSAPVVLIVEDHVVMRETLARVIELDGMRALQTGIAKDVPRLMKKYRPNVIILDVDLGGPISGIDLLRLIKNHPRWKSTAIILHTSESGVSVLPESKLADLILLKPADPDDLSIFIKRIMKKKHQENES
jgi:DNA-binding response OmpR family regulator